MSDSLFLKFCILFALVTPFAIIFCPRNHCYCGFFNALFVGSLLCILNLIDWGENSGRLVKFIIKKIKDLTKDDGEAQ
jgi:hypothetical protein